MTIDAKACIGCGHCVAICPVNAVGFADPTAILPPQDIDDNAFATMVRMRRSIRQFKPEEISATHLRQILDVLRFAPTAGNFQKVSVTVLATRDKVQEAVRRALQIYKGSYSLV
jgi:ferredoxin